MRILSHPDLNPNFSKSNSLVSVYHLELMRCYIIFFTNIPGETKVQNLVFNAIAGRFEWEGPPAPEHCDLQYIVEFTNGDPSDDISVKIREEYFEPEIHYCTNNHVTVTTWMGLLERNAGSESAKHIEPASGTFDFDF